MNLFPNGQYWRSRLFPIAALTAFLAMLSFPSQAIAAETLVVTYGGFQASFDVADLEHLSATGEAPDSMQFYLGLANLEPEALQALLIQPFNVNVEFIEDMLAASSGQSLLNKVTQVLHTESGAGSESALRAALIHSTVDDGQLSLLEVLQNYPTDWVYLNGRNLIKLTEEIETLHAEQSNVGTAD